MIAQGVWKVYKYQNRSQLSQASNQISCIRYIFFHQYHFPRLPWDGQIGDITTRSFCKNIVSWYKIGSKIQKRDTHPLLKLYFPHFISFIVPFTWRIHPHFFILIIAMSIARELKCTWQFYYHVTSMTLFGGKCLSYHDV